MKNFKPTDLIALVVILGCFVLRGLGFNGFVETMALMVMAFYFGTKTPEAIRHLKEHGQE